MDANAHEWEKTLSDANTGRPTGPWLQQLFNACNASTLQLLNSSIQHRFALMMALLFAIGMVEGRAQSPLDGFNPNAIDVVRVVVAQPDGKILLGGDFTTLTPNGGLPVTRNFIARMNPDGTLDTAFNPNASAVVQSIALQADGKILVGGNFTTIGGQTRNRIARLDAVTGLADSFNPNSTDQVLAITLQSDGKILAAGFFNGANSIGGATRNFIARLDPITGLADSFDPNASAIVRAIALQTDDRIVAGGDFITLSPNGGSAVTRNRIARLNADGTLDAGFNPNASARVQSLAIQPDGKILAGGNFATIGGQTRNRIARLNAITGLADSFDPNGDNTVFAIVVQPDGKILASGNFFTIGGQLRTNIARLDPSTGLADAFDPNTNGLVSSIAVQADGKIVAGGFFTTLAPNGGASVSRNHIARLQPTGQLDQTLNNLNNTGIYVAATAVQLDGKIIIGGRFDHVLGVARNNIARLNVDGTLDPTFNPNANGRVIAIALQPDGKILVGGEFSGPNAIGGDFRSYIARLDSTTGIPDDFAPEANQTVNSIVVQPDGKILVGGFFSGFNSIGGQARNGIARVEPEFGQADSFNPAASGPIYSISLQLDGKVLAAGGYTMIGGQSRNSIARLDPTTGLADSFDPNSNSYVESIAIQADGGILVSGNFTTIGGQPRSGMARLNPTTGLADSFNPNPNGAVVSIAIQSDGKILVGGDFFGPNSIGGQARNRIARLDPTTGLADSFNPDVNNPVYSVLVQSDGKILASGIFTTIGGLPRSMVGRLSNDTAALQKLAVTQNTVTWTRGGSSSTLTRVTFEYSTDNVNYTLLGNGTMAGNDWALTGLNLATLQNIYIRARGYYRGGFQNSSESITESVRNAFLSPTPTPTRADANPASSEQHLRHDFVLLKSGPWSGSKRDAHPHRDELRFNIV